MVSFKSFLINIYFSFFCNFPKAFKAIFSRFLFGFGLQRCLLHLIIWLILGVNVLLCLTVFQQMVSESMPITSLQIPLLGNLKKVSDSHNHLDQARQLSLSKYTFLFRFMNKHMFWMRNCPPRSMSFNIWCSIKDR